MTVSKLFKQRTKLVDFANTDGVHPYNAGIVAGERRSDAKNPLAGIAE